MRSFYMIRENDETGVSGTGKVLEGMVFSDGSCVVRWCAEGVRPTTSMYDSFEHFEALHIKPHPSNKSQIHWIDYAKTRPIKRLDRRTVGKV